MLMHPRNIVLCIFASVLIFVMLIGCDRKEYKAEKNSNLVNAPPAGRSISFSDPDQQHEFQQKLLKAGIKNYSIFSLNKNWIVWEFKDTEAVIELWEFYPSQIEMFRALKSELDNNETPKSN